MTSVSIVTSKRRRTANQPDDAHAQQKAEAPTAKRLRFFRPTSESLYRDILVMLLYVVFLSFVVMFGGYYLFSGVLLTKTAIAVSVIYTLLLLANSVRRMIKAD